MSLLERINQKRAEREKQLLKNPLYTKEYKQSYITGASAFNIPYKGMQCDWHQIETLEAGYEGRFVMHPTRIIGAEDIFGEYGIWDCSEWLKERDFGDNDYLCATPIRAILDLLYDWIVIQEEYPMTLDNFWDYLFHDLDIKELCEKLDVLKKNLTYIQLELLEKWRDNNEIYS